MKKTATLLFALLLSGTAFSQVPNANFENWAIASNGTDSLVGWSSSNAVVIPPVHSLYQDTGAYQGDYAANIVTAPFGFVQYSTIGILVNGNAAFSYGGGGGGANVAYESGGGTPVSGKPTQLKGFFRYETLTASDQGYAQVLLTKYNTTLQKRDTVSYATHSFAPQSVYAPFTITLPDLLPGMNPDTITTIFYSSNPATVPPNSAWSNLFLDSITLSTPLPLPVAGFTALPTTGSTSTVINFTDNSTNSPTAWKWTFTPATVAFQSGSTDVSQNPSLKFTANGNYTVKLVVTNAAGKDSLTKTNYIQINGGTSVEEVKAERELPLYPNPAQGRLYLKPYAQGADVRVYDAGGRLVLSRDKVAATGMDISRLSPGAYLVRLSKNDRSWSQQVWVGE